MTVLPHEECFVRFVRWGKMLNYRGSPNRVVRFEKAALHEIFRKCGLPKPDKYIRSLTENSEVTPVPKTTLPSGSALTDEDLLEFINGD
jgi:hypothetical protein